MFPEYKLYRGAYVTKIQLCLETEMNYINSARIFVNSTTGNSSLRHKHRKQAHEPILFTTESKTKSEP